MMGTKVRSFSPLPRDVSLEELVPRDHFYRRLEAEIDLSFVRDLFAPLYAGAGRPSVDPVVFFKLQLVMFFEDLRSERQLMRVVADRLSLRWYLGYDPHEPPPDHSSLTRIRERYGLTVFRSFFVEPMFAEAKQWRGMERMRLGMLERANCEVLITASGQNIKRLLAFGGRGPRRPAQVVALRPPERSQRTALISES